jgi:hypothetical protein
MVVLAATLAVTGALVLTPMTRARQWNAFPTVYKLDEGAAVAGTNGLLTVTGTMRAADGTYGTLKNTYREKRVAGGTVHCGGKTYHGPFTENLKNPGGGTFVIDWGTAPFKTTLTVAVFRKAGVGSSPPICYLSTGTYRFTAGRVKGKHGTFTAHGTNLLTGAAKDTLVFH